MNELRLPELRLPELRLPMCKSGMLLLITAMLLGGCSKDLVVLMPDEAGAVGAVEVRSEGMTSLLNEALQSIKIDEFENSVQARPIPLLEVQERFANALAAQPEKPKDFVLYFVTGTTKLAPGSDASLRAMMADVDRRPSPQVQVTGHTDRVGSLESNDELSLERAQRVREVLIEQQGLPESQISAVGRGEREPLVPTADGVGQAKNRRVEITVR